jgi:hypothetical protein
MEDCIEELALKNTAPKPTLDPAALTVRHGTPLRL